MRLEVIKMSIVYNYGESLVIFDAADIEKLLKVFYSVTVSQNCITLFSETKGSLSIFQTFVMYKSNFFDFDKVVFEFVEDLNDIKVNIKVIQKDTDISFLFEC